MTKSANNNSVNKLNLLPHQVKFIDSFLKPGGAARHHLVSPVGMGRTAMLAGLIDRMVTEQQATHILIIAHSSLLLMFEHLLRDVIKELPLMVVDKKAFRSLQMQSDKDISPWQAPIIAIMSFGIAKQEDVASTLSSAKWDLVVVDEFQTTTGLARQFLDSFIEGTDIARLLLLSTKTDAPPPQLEVIHLQITEWSGEIKDWDGKLLYSLPKRRVQVMSYERSATEIALIQGLKKYLDPQNPFRIKNIERQYLLRAASSSIYAIENALRNRRNKLAYGKIHADLSDDKLGEDIDDEVQDLERSSHSGSSDDSIELMELTLLLGKLDQIQIDSKVDALERLISNSLLKGNDSIVVFSELASTASYLSAFFKNFGSAVYLITGNVPLSERAQMAHQIRQSGGIVITSAVSLEGISFGNVRFGVSFDLPQSALNMERRWSAIGRLYRGGESIMYTFWDKTGTLAFEEIGFRKYAFLVDDSKVQPSREGSKNA